MTEIDKAATQWAESKIGDIYNNAPRTKAKAIAHYVDQYKTIAEEQKKRDIEMITKWWAENCFCVIELGADNDIHFKSGALADLREYMEKDCADS